MTYTQDQVQALVAAAVKEATAKTQNKLSLKIGAEKKTLSVYGLGRFPVTLYAGQWQRLLPMAAEITQFIEAHKADLAWK